jgi:hypothetical protein
LDVYEKRLDTTCNTLTEIKTTLSNFIDSVNKREQETRNNMEKRYKNITVVFGSITSVSVLIGISKVFGLI